MARKLTVVVLLAACGVAPGLDDALRPVEAPPPGEAPASAAPADPIRVSPTFPGGFDLGSNGTCVDTLPLPRLSDGNDAGVIPYECPGNEKRLVFGLEGTAKPVTFDEVQALRVKLEAQLFALPGVIGLGTGTCCTARSTELPACIQVLVSSQTTSPEVLAAEVRAATQGSGVGCLGLDVTVVGAPKARCDAEGPTCQPLPMCDSVSTPCCASLKPYDPNAGRQPVPAAYDMLSRGSCTSDGQCVIGGAGNHCLSWQTPGFLAPALCYPALSEAHCGCVRDECRWFTQP